METLFGRKKSRPRQSSVSAQDLNERSIPYDKLTPPTRSPLPVATVSQGYRGISAPSSNPSLTASGTELNKYAVHRSKAERDKLYELHATDKRPGSPSTSISTADSSTLCDDPVPLHASAYASKFTPQTPHSSRLRLSEASSSSGTRSSSAFDFAPATPSTSQNVTIRPASGMTTRSESSRTSKYAPSLASSDHTTHHSLFYHSRSHNPSETFYFPRPETDEEIEALFENVKRTRDLGDLPDLPIEQKWHMVYNDEQIRWKDEKLREEQARKQGEVGQHTIVQESPEWYIRKFLEGTITPKQASSLLVSLRGKEMSWFRQFVAIQGPSVLAQALFHLSRKGSSRSDYDISLEYEVVKCLKQILNYAPTAKDVLGQPYFVTQIASSLNTPHIPTRKLTLDLLSFISYYDEARYHQMVVSALEALSVANNEGSACYDYWFKSMEQSILGRGKMGSLVGASDEVRRAGGVDSSLNDYALANLLLLNGVVEHIEDLDVRLHHRSQMESAGLQRIIDICQRFEIEALDKHLKILRTRLDDDERRLRERLDQEILRDLNNPQEIYDAIYAKTQNTKAQNYFLSMMRHLLLIREEGQSMVHYYQLLDSLVTDVVMDKKLAGAEQRFGHSVEQIIAQFNEADRYQALESELAEMRASAVRFKLEKDTLEDEIAQGQDGLVGQLKSQLAHAEEKLNVSRETTSRLQGQLATQRVDYEERITQLEAQIMELFRMLREVGKGVEMVLDGGVLDRRALVQQLEKDFQRKKTISILEGKDGYARKLKNSDIPAATEDVSEKDLDTTPIKRTAGRGSRAASSTKRSPSSTKAVAVDDNSRTSQFMDADEADAQEQIQQQIAAGVTIYSPPVGTVSASRSVRGSPRRTFKPPLGSALDSSSRLSSLLSPPSRNPEGTSDLSRSPSPTFDDEDGSLPSVRSGSSDRTEATGVTSLNSQNMNSVKGESSVHRLDTDSSAPTIQAVDKGLPPPPPPPPPPMMSGSAALGHMQAPAPPPPPPPPPPMGYPTSIAFVPKSGIPPPPPPPPPPPSKKNSPSNSVHTSRNSALLSPLIGNLLMARKDMPITPSIKMKQLQWDKLPHQQVAKTLWKEEQPEKENEMLQKLQRDGVWSEIEEDFKAKQLVINLMARQKRAELKSVLDPQTKKRVEILIQRVRKLEPEEIAQRIRQFDQDLCNQAFLSELKTVLPSPEQVGKLSVYRNADSVELADLHPSDRLMVQLIKIDRLGPRIEGMLYKCTFEESWVLLDDGARKLSRAGRSLLEAKHFKELLSLILLIGNYMNGTGIKGGAFGFRVSSINKLVDTKSVNNTTLLHFLEKTVSRQFPEMQGFLDELEKPAEAYRVNLQDLRKSLTELRDGLKRIRHELGEHFSDMSQNDQYGKQMWSFIGKASAQMDDLIYDISNAETTFTDVIDYYGEEDKNMSSSEFYGIFKTFVTSYKKCQADNHAAAEEKLAIEKRKQALQQTKISRQQAEAMFVDEGDDILDNLLEKLRKGDTVVRRARRARPSGEPAGLSSSSNIQDFPASNETVDRARNMLAQLQSDGFVTSVSPTTSTFQRRRRRRAESVGEDQVSTGMGSPLASEIRIEEDEEDVQSVDEGTM